ncbi:MAG TPA: hypothetical protein VKU00_04545 [Chthonomonadaceae bacterium]|nr:hypothetical protein [Chthonomonadaceae bacterium]
MATAQNEMTLHLHSGIPVVDIEGVWSEKTEGALGETVRSLLRAGHFDIIVNLSHSVGIPLPERRWLESLEQLATSLRARCGRLDVVGTVDQVRECLRRQARTGLRWATSEEEAVCRIKGIPLATRGPIVSARLKSA